MAERSDRAPSRWRRPFLHWLDGVEAGWAVPLLVGCFVAVWTLYLAIAYAGGGTLTRSRPGRWGGILPGAIQSIHR